MNLQRSTVFTAALVGACVALSRPALASVVYSVTDLGPLPNSFITPHAISADGSQVVGDALVGGSTYHAFLWNGTPHDFNPPSSGESKAYGVNSTYIVGEYNFNGGSGGSDLHAFRYDGTFHDLGTLGGVNSSARAINAAGTIAGESENANGKTRGFYYDTSMHAIPTIGGVNGNAFATGLNAAGAVVGYSDVSAGGQHAFLYDGTTHDLGTLGGTNSFANGINDNGRVVGYSELTIGQTNYDPFYVDPSGTPQDMGTFGGTFGQAMGVNSAGNIVGFAYTTGNTASRAFIFQGAGLVDLNTEIAAGSGWTLQQATALNDAGQIVGVGTFDSGPHAFLLTAVPEPGGCAAVLAIGLGLSWRRRRQ